MQFSFAYTSGIWSKVRITFWASSNNQIQIGVLSLDNIQVVSGCAYAYASLAQSFAQNDSPVIRIFLNGWNVAGNDIAISASPINLQTTKLTIKITVSNTTQLKSASFSYLAFAPNSASFGSYGGSLAQTSFLGSKSQDISNTLYQTPYLLYGLFEFQLNGAQGLTFSSLIDSNLVLTASSSRNFN